MRRARASPRCCGGTFAAGDSRRIGDYTLGREIGRGGMGIVYEARDGRLGRTVALKLFPQHGLLDPTALARFRREAQSAAMLHHRHIVPVYEVGESDGLPFHAMQLISGKSLHHVIDELRESGSGRGRGAGSSGSRERLLEDAPTGSWTGTLSTNKSSEYYRRIAALGAQAAGALAYAHSEGVLHRDVKPANLLLDEGGDVWLTDFGLAKLEREADALTRSGDTIGTLAYMAPERFEGWSDPRSDVYSLGLTLYELATLQRAFDSPHRTRLRQQVREAVGVKIVAG